MSIKQIIAIAGFCVLSLAYLILAILHEHLSPKRAEIALRIIYVVAAILIVYATYAPKIK